MRAIPFRIWDIEVVSSYHIAIARPSSLSCSPCIIAQPLALCLRTSPMAWVLARFDPLPLILTYRPHTG